MTSVKAAQEPLELTARDDESKSEQAESLAPTQIKQVQLVCALGVTGQREPVAREIAVALIYNGISHVVMIASPGDLEALALGFSLSAGIIAHAREIQDIHCRYQPLGIDVNITVNARAMSRLKQQRRNMTGLTGCGLCGTGSLHQGMRPINTKSQGKAEYIEFKDIQNAVANLEQWQTL
jgi:FdhD protein